MKFEVKQKISTEEKFDAIDLSVREATVGNMLNSCALDVFVKVNLLMAYTDIEIPEEFDHDKLAFYDFLVEEGILEEFNSKINPEEIKIFNRYFETWVQDYKEYLNSGRGVVEAVKDAIYEMVNQTSDNLDSLKELDLSQLQQLIPLAESLGIDYDKIKETP